MRVGYTQIRELAPDELALVPGEERDREFGSEQRRQQYLCGRSLLRLMLQECTGRPAASIELAMLEHGKPVCVDGPAVGITHTGDTVACGIADRGELGIDLEIVNERRDTTKVARKFYSSEEADWLDTQPRDRFFMLWVLKEAYVKAKGQSIFGSVNRLRCKVVPPSIEPSDHCEPFRDLCLYAAGDAYLALVTTEASLRDVSVERWESGGSTLQADAKFKLTASSYDYAN